MKVKMMQVGPIGTNCYILEDETTRKSAIIDPGDEAEQILFALNEQTHPGEKRLVRLCRERCPLLPERFEENLEQLFADLFAGNGRVEEDVRAILGALEKILIPIFEM